MRPPNPETDQECRSLLQKAVRRGHSELACAAMRYLQHRGDSSWLRRRVGVIIFEECWPAAAYFAATRSLDGITQSLACTARCAKYKDAAGLGSLAYALQQGDNSVLSAGGDTGLIRYIAISLDNPEEFWREMASRCTNDGQTTLVKAAQTAFRQGGWPWDRTFALAAALLATNLPFPSVTANQRKREADFPYWVAIDRHTPYGKTALRNVAHQLGVPSNRLTWVSFYLESARTNRTVKSPWWERERLWRLSKVGVDYKEAFDLWARAQPLLIELVNDRAEGLRRRLQTFVQDFSSSAYDLDCSQMNMRSPTLFH